MQKPGFFNSFPATVGSREFAQLGQASIKKKTSFYDYGLVQNNAVYGSPQPPDYDVSKITSKGLYFWGAANDGLISLDDVQRNVNDLSVDYVYTKFDQPGVIFNHGGYLFHKRKFQLLFAPSLQILESYSAQ